MNVDGCIFVVVSSEFNLFLKDNLSALIHSI